MALSTFARRELCLSKAARQTARIRRAFLDAALKYEMSFFDREGCTGVM